MLAFVYKDDIVICYKTKDTTQVDSVVAESEANYTPTHLGELRWFLGIHVVRKRAKETL